MEPVLVIHGIGNRNKAGFEQEVQQLQKDFEQFTGQRKFQFLPVFWGDLAARTDDLDACMPELEPMPNLQIPEIKLDQANLGPLMQAVNRLPALFAAPIKAQLETALNQAAGEVLRSYLAQQYQNMRVENRHMVTTSLGDIMVYQRNQSSIQARIWEVLKAFDVKQIGYGTSRKKVHVVAHSLGGVIAVDTIIRKKSPLCAKSLTTFGSQFAYFHLTDPRISIPAYQGRPIPMPATLYRWINLWEPLDPLSFVASRMFVLSDGTAVEDVQVKPQGGFTELLQGYYYTHGIYWKTPELLLALKKNLLG